MLTTSLDFFAGRKLSLKRAPACHLNSGLARYNTAMFWKENFGNLYAWREVAGYTSMFCYNITADNFDGALIYNRAMLQRQIC